MNKTAENHNHSWFCSDEQKLTYPQRIPITSMSLSSLPKLKASKVIYKARDSYGYLCVVFLSGAHCVTMNVSIHCVSILCPEYSQRNG